MEKPQLKVKDEMTGVLFRPEFTDGGMENIYEAVRKKDMWPPAGRQNEPANDKTIQFYAANEQKEREPAAARTISSESRLSWFGGGQIGGAETMSMASTAESSKGDLPRPGRNDCGFLVLQDYRRWSELFLETLAPTNSRD